MLASRFIRARSYSAYVLHRDTQTNNAFTRFDFNDDDYDQIDKILAKYPTNYKKSAVIPLLYVAQKRANNYIPLAAMRKISKILAMPAMEVYEVASFYTMFNRTPVGKFHLQICGTTPCMVRGAQSIIKAAEEEADCLLDQTSHDGMFTLSEVECLGACANAPMIQVNNETTYEDLTAETMKDVMRKMRSGEDHVVGSQNGRNHCEGIQGRTSLKGAPPVWPARDFAGAKEEFEAKKAAAAAPK